MKLWYSIIHHALLLLGIVEKRFSFACPAGVKVPIRMGDCKIKDANVYNSMTTTKCQKTIPKISQHGRGGITMPKSLRILLDMVWVILLSPILINGVICKLTQQWARKQTQQRRVELAMITFLDMKMGGMGS